MGDGFDYGRHLVVETDCAETSHQIAYGFVYLIQFFTDKILVPREGGPFFMFMYIHRYPCFLQIYGFADNKPHNLRFIIRKKAVFL